MLLLKTAFLDLSTAGLSGWKILSRGQRPVHRGTFTSVPGLCPPAASVSHPTRGDGQQRLQTMLNVPWGLKTALTVNHELRISLRLQAK